jgi:hypothetical protein
VEARHAQRVAQLFLDLNSDDFERREKATNELDALKETAEPALRRALESSPDAEVRQRAEALLKKLEGEPRTRERVRLSRSLEVLERIGGTASKRLLKSLSEGATDAWLSEEATASLERMARRSAQAP